MENTNSSGALQPKLLNIIFLASIGLVLLALLISRFNVHPFIMKIPFILFYLTFIFASVVTMLSLKGKPSMFIPIPFILNTIILLLYQFIDFHRTPAFIPVVISILIFAALVGIGIVFASEGEKGTGLHSVAALFFVYAFFTGLSSLLVVLKNFHLVQTFNTVVLVLGLGIFSYMLVHQYVKDLKPLPFQSDIVAKFFLVLFVNSIFTLLSMRIMVFG
jgi:hypothetical protein